MRNRPPLHGLRPRCAPVQCCAAIATAAASGRIDLDVFAGETVALMGRNGCGKTTLLRMLATVSRPRGGEVRWSGGDAGAARARLGLALDGALEDGGLTGRQATHFWCAQWVGDPREVARRVDAILHRLGLARRRGRSCGHVLVWDAAPAGARRRARP